ncbi:hypothetical protein HS125_00500 [bacterium]|nr:hypothetical protein [bacterium]
MMARVWLTVAALVFVPEWASAQPGGASATVGAATAGGPTSPAYPSDPVEFVRRFDRNRDGRITRGEIPSATDFAEMDQNDDGVLDRWEIELAGLTTREEVEAFLGRRDRDGSGGLSATELPVSATRYAILDADVDKQISPRELEGVVYLALRRREPVAAARPPQLTGDPEDPAGLFERSVARWDADKDGRITRGEFTGPATMWEFLDRNGDGEVTAEEIREAQAAFRTMARQRSMELDTDRDGRISRQEFKGGDEEWKLMDRNRDGYIDQADRLLPLPGQESPPAQAPPPDIPK